jgi:hypothetical protein
MQNGLDRKLEARFFYFYEEYVKAATIAGYLYICVFIYI